MMSDFSTTAKSPPRAIAIAAHPDDIEFLMAGTLLRLRDAGFETHYMNVANGCCGTTQYDVATIAKMRCEEGRDAAAALGATFHESICNDLEVFYNEELLRKIASVIRQVAPSIVLTHSPTDYMEDHTNTCRLAVTAAFSRGMPNFRVTPDVDPVHVPVTVYHAQPYSNLDPMRQPVVPELFVDVSDMQDEKKRALACHVSQKQWLDESQGLDSYLHTLSELDAQVGRLSGKFEFSEGWRRRLHLGFCGPDDDPLQDALGSHVIQARRASE
jgi:N-acetylglucosamine malate deacetylase 1